MYKDKAAEKVLRMSVGAADFQAECNSRFKPPFATAVTSTSTASMP